MKSSHAVLSCFVACVSGVYACSGSDGGASTTPPVDGGASDSSAMPDGGVTPDAQSPDGASPPDASGPVTLVDATPTDGALHVGLTAPVKLHFSGSLLASSVSVGNVMLLAPNASVAVPATVSYDDPSHTITIAPKIVLTAGAVYRVAMKSLVAADMSAAVTHDVSFTALYDSYQDNITYDATGTTITALTSYTRTADGRVNHRVSMGKGADMVFQTADDVPTGYGAYTYSAGGYRVVTYNGAGTDATWFTADDVISTYADVDTSVLGHTRTIYRSGPGPDMTWQTADDAFGTLYETFWTADGREQKSIAYSGPGPDAMPFTADDVISYRFADTWTATGGQRVEYTGAGVDGLWNTADDVISNVNDYVLDALGRTTALVFIGKGPDGTYLTADDVTTQAWTTIYDAMGMETQFRIIGGAGADGVWLTADDVVQSYFGYAYGPSGALVTRKSFAAGPDGVFFTADDLATYVEHYDTSL